MWKESLESPFRVGILEERKMGDGGMLKGCGIGVIEPYKITVATREGKVGQVVEIAEWEEFLRERWSYHRNGGDI